MKKKIAIILITIFVVSALFFAVQKIIKSSAEGVKRMPLIVNVNIGKLKKGDISNTESLTGTIYSDQQANIYSKVSGNIEKVFVNIGDFVKQGQLLALIDTSIYSQNLKLASANYNQATATAANSKLLFDRNSKLLEQNLISKQEVDNSKTAYEVTLAQKDAAFANYSNAITQLSYCRITAPFTGYITKRMLDAGVYVTASAASQSSNLFILSDLTKLKIITNIPEKDISILDRITDIEVIPDALPEQLFKGKLNRISGSIDLSTRTMEVQIDINDNKKVLKPGMFTKISLITEKKSNINYLPNEVIQSDPNGDYVFVVNGNPQPNSTCTVSKKYVKLGLKQETKCEIVSGIDENDNLVVVGQNLIKDGSTVKIAK
ncbi:MAG: efflux RND transporter periplasmic adaptor subunit [Candidatus Kapabacteria bacterium]|nr:efflux RND transporter periplasmic adaptor subunit [Candidatus Kapabacteria bacterium]